MGEEHEELVQELKGMAVRGDPEHVLKRLRQFYARTKDMQLKQRLGDLLKYIGNNIEGITNYTKVGYYGSGAVEKTIDVTICRRFKNRAMGWQAGGANNLIRLRMLKLNREWDQYWTGRQATSIRWLR